MAAYWVARSKVNDPVEYKKYTDLVPDIIAKYGGKVLARGGRFQIMEGPNKFHRFIVIDRVGYASCATARAAYNPVADAAVPRTKLRLSMRSSLVGRLAAGIFLWIAGSYRASPGGQSRPRGRRCAQSSLPA